MAGIDAHIGISIRKWYSLMIKNSILWVRRCQWTGLVLMHCRQMYAVKTVPFSLIVNPFWKGCIIQGVGKQEVTKVVLFVKMVGKHGSVPLHILIVLSLTKVRRRLCLSMIVCLRIFSQFYLHIFVFLSPLQNNALLEMDSST